MGLLRCPGCSSPLREDPDGWECTRCDAAGEIDAAGVLHLEPADQVGPPPADRVELDPETPPDQAPELISDAISARVSSTATWWDYLAAFFPNAAGFAVLGATHHGTRSLVLSSGWGNLPRVIASLGGEVVAMDSLHEGLVYTSMQAPTGGLGCVCSSLQLPLPFADDAFDSVFLDAAGSEGSSRREALLGECARILRPGGYVVLLSWNPTSPLKLSSSPELGRPATATKPALATKAGCRELLERSGFETPRYYVPWPDHASWECMVSESGLAESQLTLDGTSWKRRVAQVALDLSRHLGMSEYLVPSHCFVASVPHADAPHADTPHADTGDAPPPASTLEVVARAVGVEPDGIRRLDSHANSNCLSFRTDRHFVKIPLTRYAADRLAGATQILGNAAAEMTGDGFIVAPLPGFEVEGIPLGVYPLVDHEDLHGDLRGEWPDKVARLALALDRMGLDRRDVPLGRTDFWHRLMEDRAREEFHRLAPDLPVLERLAPLEGRRVPSGLVHGDLGTGNLIRDLEGRIRLIDWDRCEGQSPKFLDTVHGCMSLARTHHAQASSQGMADRIFNAWDSLLARDPAIPFLDRIDEDRGELSWNEAIGLTILNEIDQHQRSLRENPILRDAHHEMLLRRLQIVMQALDDPGPPTGPPADGPARRSGAA